MSSNRDPPRRGGEHPTYGIFIGGSDLDDQYKLTGTRHYKYTSQRRGAKVVNSIEQALLSTIASNSSPKFNGNLERTPSTQDTELDKLNFIKQLKRKVQLHGQQSFYAALSADTQVVSLFEHYHKFTVEDIIDQCELRSEEPNPDLDPNTGDETETSKQLRFESYDEYEFDEFGLTRLVVESLITPELLERITTKFGNDDKFDTYPGQVLFMMALDTCNASVQRDVAGAQVAFDELSLDNYPGEDVTELATEALRLIHILSGSYSLPINLGSKLIKKVTNTSSEFFNRKMFALLDSARTLETKYRLRDPASMGNDPEYTSFGPYAICAALQDEHGKLIADADWPALATKLPESNTTGNIEMSPTKSLEKPVQCYRCKQWGHKANNPICPLFSTRKISGPGAPDTQEPRSEKDKKGKPKDPWKYIEPRDLTQPVDIDGRKWYYCTKCKCRVTGNIGFYQLSHTDATHDPHWRPESNSTPITDPDPTPLPPLRASEASQGLDDDLVFTGVNLAPVISHLDAHGEREMPTEDMKEQNIAVVAEPGTRHIIIDTTRVSPSCPSVPAPAALCVPVDKCDWVDSSLNQNKTFVSESAFVSSTEVEGFSEFGISTTVLMRNSTLLTSLSVLWHFLSLLLAIVWTYVYRITGTVTIWVSETGKRLSCDMCCLIIRYEFYLWLLVLLEISDVGFPALLFIISQGFFWIGYILFVRLIQYKASTVVNATRQGTKFNSTGFPAKWLIFTAVMISSYFWPCIVGDWEYTLLTVFFDVMLGNFLAGSVCATLMQEHGTYWWDWAIKPLYSNFKLNSKLVIDKCNDFFAQLRIRWILTLSSRPTATFGQQVDMPRVTHIIDTVMGKATHMKDEFMLNVAPAISAKSEEELFTSLDLEVNLLTSPLQPVIFDTGASLAITGDKEDFLSDSFKETSHLKLGGMASGASITGVGNVAWTFPCKNNDHMTIITRCYLVPKASTRLLSPQCIFDKQNGHPGKFGGDEEQFYLEYDSKPIVSVGYSNKSNLPIGYAISTSQDDAEPMVNLSLLDDENQNLTAGQKLLLEYHYKFGHTNMPLVQHILRSEGFSAGKYGAASKCRVPKCSVCEYAKGHRRSTRGAIHTPTPTRDGTLKINDLRVGSTISVDHFESRLKGRTFDSFGKATSDKYIGGCIFVDHASGYVHVEFQLGFSAIETIRAKQNFEKFAFNHGVIPITYLTDSGAFKANKFVQHIRDHNQKIQFCGTNAHHQNGVAERAIRTISNMARAMLLHASAHWKHGIDPSMWPMAVQYAAYVSNILPRSNNVSPSDLFFGTRIPRHKLQNLHVWGCPVYVLNPSLQSGNKIPRWEPRSTLGVFCGLSTIHSSEVPQVLNRTTGSITTQYHVVFDDLFTTVPSIERVEEPPSNWQDLCLEHTEYIPIDAPLQLSPEWVSESDHMHASRQETRTNRVRQDLQTASDLNPRLSDPLRLPTPSSEGVLPLSSSERMSIQPSDEVPPSTQQRESVLPVASTPTFNQREPSGPRRSPRATKGQYQSTRYINEIFLAVVDQLGSLDEYTNALVYQAELDTDMDTLESNITDARVYNAKFNRSKSDPDTPTFKEAMASIEADKYIDAMKEEIANLKRMNTWDLVDRDPHMKVLKGTWAFKLKRTPDGVPYRYRSRFCVRGDQQEYGVNYFETFAPVIQWSTIRLLLILILTNSWKTRVIDYTNAFPQANIDTDIYVEMPALFGSKMGQDKVMKLKKSLYGLKQSPRTFYQHLSKSLQNRGWTVSSIDPCLFMKKDMVCVIYVDDTIFAGPTQEMIDAEVKLLGIKQNNEEHPLEFRDEGELSAFLGIKIEQRANNEYYLSQPGLITKVLEAAGMQDCNPNLTPSALDPLGPDLEGEVMNEEWEYASIVGMLMYLANNTRPDIAHAVHACARYTHNPKKSHATAVKHILRYLKGTDTKGMILKPNKRDNLDCYVDSDFAGNYLVYPDQDPGSTKSRTGYVIFYQGCPILWVSKMQTQCALSTMESEYLALSQSMRDLIPLREVLKEINHVVFDNREVYPKCTTNSKSFSDIVSDESESPIPKSRVYEDNNACLKFARLPRLTPRTKHIAVPYHWFRSKVEQLEIAIEPISTEDQLADQFTKPLASDKFLSARKSLMGW